MVNKKIYNNEPLENQWPEAEKGRLSEGKAVIAGPTRAIFGHGYLAVDDCSHVGEGSALCCGGDGREIWRNPAFTQCKHAATSSIFDQNDDALRGV